jgi:hypothetical protein
MKILLSILFALAMALGKLFAQAPQPDWAHFHTPQTLTETYVMSESYPTLTQARSLNLEQVKRSMKEALAAECQSLKGRYTFEVLVDQEGKYVTHKSGKLAELPLVSHPWSS